MPLMLLGEFCRERRGGDLPADGEKGFLGEGAGVGVQGGVSREETAHTLTFGSPSMSPDPGSKKESRSVSCPLFRGGASTPSLPPEPHAIAVPRTFPDPPVGR